MISVQRKSVELRRKTSTIGERFAKEIPPSSTRAVTNVNFCD